MGGKNILQCNRVLTWSVLRLLSSVCTQARSVNSWINISAALANNMGASALIIFTSSSSFMIFFIRARGSAWVFKSSYKCHKNTKCNKMWNVMQQKQESSRKTFTSTNLFTKSPKTGLSLINNWLITTGKCVTYILLSSYGKMLKYF